MGKLQVNGAISATGSFSSTTSGARLTTSNDTQTIWFGLNSAGSAWGIYNVNTEAYIIKQTANATNFYGNSSTASKWLTARILTLAGDTTGSVSIDGSGNVTLTSSIRQTSLTDGFQSSFRTSIKGNSSSGPFISVIRSESTISGYTSAYGSGLAFGKGDTHGYIYLNYNSAQVYIGAGSSNQLNWVKQLAFTDSTVAGANYANSAGYASSANSANSASSADWASGATYANSIGSSTGFGSNNFTYLQTSGDFYGSTGWAHYLIANHGDGASYYNYVIRLPFWNSPQYKYQTGDTSAVHGWYDFITSENYTSYCAPASHSHSYLSLSGGTMTKNTWYNYSAPSDATIHFGSFRNSQPSGTYYRPWMTGVVLHTDVGYGNTVVVGQFSDTYSSVGFYIGHSWDGNNSDTFHKFYRDGHFYTPRPVTSNYGTSFPSGTHIGEIYFYTG